MAAELWPMIPDHSLAIVDRDFFSARILIGLERGGIERHWLTRARSDLVSRRIERFASGDELVELTVSREARVKDPSMPETCRMRAIRYQRRGFKPQLLLTSMLDPKRVPADEVVALYHERWEIELGYNEVKRVMLAREGSPFPARDDRDALEEAGVSPMRISFLAALRFIESAFRMWGVDSAGRLPERLRNLRDDIGHYILPERRQRSYPRAVKIKMSNYQRKRPTKSSSKKRAK